ncbi:PREDICTED: uncharacterized protein LOC104589039 [Nelumbo nucifera]|uniref:Uncharacterized protein LOC104589039 n=1 Tax=Nelumbo nucifera TaxID=4432 RepID=A0A1U7Z0K7_NELNU|nr:PREDICTED: uncharacterized protein LOC104589039 [Nelumbo nucifera]
MLPSKVRVQLLLHRTPPKKVSTKHEQKRPILEEGESSHPPVAKRPRSARVPRPAQPSVVPQLAGSDMASSQTRECWTKAMQEPPAPTPKEKDRSDVESAQSTIVVPPKKVTCVRFSSGRVKKMAPRPQKRGPEGEDSFMETNDVPLDSL